MKKLMLVATLALSSLPAFAQAGHVCIVYSTQDSADPSDDGTTVTCDGKQVKSVKGIDNPTISAVLEGVVGQGFRIVGATENQYSDRHQYSSQTWTLEKD